MSSAKMTPSELRAAVRAAPAAASVVAAAPVAAAPVAAAPVAAPVSADRWHPAHRPTWFLELMEELEPFHDCTEARLASHVCVINRIQSIINWNILRDIEPVNIAETSKMNDNAYPDDKHKLTDLDLILRQRADALLESKNPYETIGTEVAIQILVGEFLFRTYPTVFTKNIHKIDLYANSFQKRKKTDRTVSYSKSDVKFLFQGWKDTDFFYSEATGIGAVTKYVKEKRIEPLEIATRYVDPASTKKTFSTLSFTGYSDDLVELLGNIKCSVNPPESSNTNTSTSSTNDEEGDDKNVTSVVIEKFSDFPLLAFPTAAAAGLVADILSEYHNERMKEVDKTQTQKQVIEAVQYLIDSQEEIESNIDSRKSNTSINSNLNLPHRTLKSLLHDLILKGANHLIQIADLAESGAYRFENESNTASSTSNSVNESQLKKEVKGLGENMNVRRNLGPLPSPENVTKYKQSYSGPSPVISEGLRSRRHVSPSVLSRMNENESIFEYNANDDEVKFRENVLPQVKKVYEKSTKNIKNFVKLVTLAVNIYEELYKKNPESALQITMRTVLHLKSYGDSFQLKELDSIMNDPKNAEKTLWLTSIDRIFLALAGLYALDSGWNLITIQQSSNKKNKEFLILRDYRRFKIPQLPLPSPLPPPPKKLTKKLSSKRGRPRLGPKSIIYSSPRETARQSAMRAAATARLTRAEGTRRSGRFLSPLAPSSPPYASQFAFAPSSRSAFGAPAPAAAPVNPIDLRINLPDMPPDKTRNLALLSPIESTSPQGAISSLSQGYNPSPNSNVIVVPNKKNGGFYRHRQHKTLKKRKGRRHTRRRT